MTEQSGGMRLLPTLGVALILVLVAALALLTLKPGDPAQGPAPVPGAAAFTEAHAAYRLAAGAMRGDARAFTGLAAANRRIAAADLDGIDAEHGAVSSRFAPASARSRQAAGNWSACVPWPTAWTAWCRS